MAVHRSSPPAQVHTLHPDELMMRSSLRGNRGLKLKTAMPPMDQGLLYATLALTLFGLLAVYTASANQSIQESGNSYYYVLRQSLAVGLGLVGMVGLSWVHFKHWQRYGHLLAGVSLGLLALTMLVGVTANGSERWISLPGGLQFQPSEVAKIAAIILMAQASSQERRFSPLLGVNLLLVMGMIGLIYLQPNLSVSIILSTITLSMLFVSGVPVWMFVATLPPLLMGVGYKIRNTEYQWKRIVGWLDWWGLRKDEGYNLMHSLFAIGSGGFFGKGLGHSIQKLGYLPFQHTDFIFAVLCEELGVFATVMVITLFGLIGWRGFSIAMACTRPFGRMLAFGLTSCILLQAAINISVNIGLMPATGVTLPLISYGGTSVVITLAMIGMLLNISRQNHLPQPVRQ